MTEGGLASLRREYIQGGLTESDLLPNPIDQFGRWFHQAVAAEVVEPNAMVLTTATLVGVPSLRTVLLKDFDARGFVFFTNYESAKGSELARNPSAALLFPWLALERQVLIQGEVERVSREETEEYFRQRPRGSQIGAWASRQSSVVSGRAELEASWAVVESRFADAPIPAPPHWGGYRLVPTSVELWQGRSNRMHDRLRYRRDPNRPDAWQVERLSP